MAAPVYATADELRTWLDASVPIPPEAARLLARASRVVDRLVTARYAIDSTTQQPTDSDVVEAFRDATCAVVEYWTEVGEGVDVVPAGGRMSFAGLSMDATPTWYPPRAAEVLRLAGLRAGPHHTADTPMRERSFGT